MPATATPAAPPRPPGKPPRRPTAQPAALAAFALGMSWFGHPGVSDDEIRGAFERATGEKAPAATR